MGNKVKIKVDEFVEEYMSCIPEDLFLELMGMETKYTYLPENVVEAIKEKREVYRQEENMMCRCAELNNRGIECEKNGEIDKAIAVYEENVRENGRCLATHSFDRLMVLYRKLKDYENEIRVIREAISLLRIRYDVSKYEKRLEKAIALKEKRK